MKNDVKHLRPRPSFRRHPIRSRVHSDDDDDIWKPTFLYTNNIPECVDILSSPSVDQSREEEEENKR